MKQNIFILLLVLISAYSCNEEMQESALAVNSDLLFDKINYYSYPISQNDKPIKYRLSYSYNNKKPYRWLELDSAGRVMTDYIYEYDEDWIQTGAKYREDGVDEFSIERVSFRNDSTRVTQWLDSLGNVYYTMVDNLNKFNKTYRAEFIGDKTHGFDSTFYTREGFEKRIFFTNTNGKVYNDRQFEYDSINPNEDWVIRRKIMKDTVREIQMRELYYQPEYVPNNGKYYQGYISSGEWSENVFSFTEDRSLLFFTRASDWSNQSPYISTLKNGIYTEPKPLNELGILYNGAISPSGNKIIFCTRSEDNLRIFLANKKENHWTNIIDLTENSGLYGGYFSWINETDLCFQSEEHYGDLKLAKLQENTLIVTDHLEALNTDLGTEFSPFMGPNKEFIIFTKYVEGDIANQGFFVSYKEGDYKTPVWTEPSKLEMLPYGWNASINPLNKQFMYTDGEDINVLPLETLNLKAKFLSLEQ